MLSFTLERPRLIRRTARSCVLTTHRRNAAHGGLVTSAGAPFPLTHRPPAAPHRTGKSYARPVLPLHSDLKNQGFFFPSFMGFNGPTFLPQKVKKARAKKLQNNSSFILPTRQPSPCHLIPTLPLLQVATRSKHSTYFPPVSFGGEAPSPSKVALVHAGAAAVRAVDRGKES